MSDPLLGEPAIIREVTRAIKAHRNGEPRAYIMVMITPDGKAELISNMDVNAQRCQLLASALDMLIGQTHTPRPVLIS